MRSTLVFTLNGIVVRSNVITIIMIRVLKMKLLQKNFSMLYGKIGNTDGAKVERVAHHRQCCWL